MRNLYRRPESAVVAPFLSIRKGCPLTFETRPRPRTLVPRVRVHLCHGSCTGPRAERQGYMDRSSTSLHSTRLNGTKKSSTRI